MVRCRMARNWFITNCDSWPCTSFSQHVAKLWLILNWTLTRISDSLNLSTLTFTAWYIRSDGCYLSSVCLPADICTQQWSPYVLTLMFTQTNNFPTPSSLVAPRNRWRRSSGLFFFLYKIRVVHNKSLVLLYSFAERHRLHHPPFPPIFYSWCFPFASNFASYCE